MFSGEGGTHQPNRHLTHTYAHCGHLAWFLTLSLRSQDVVSSHLEAVCVCVCLWTH